MSEGDVMDAHKLGEQARDEGLATNLAYNTPYPYDAWLPVVRRLIGYGMSDEQIEVTANSGLSPDALLVVAAMVTDR